MKNKWNKILLELSYRVSTGIPDLSNEQHLMKLWDILKEHNWNIDARVELLKNLNELDFRTPEQFAAYKAKHKMRPGTVVNVAGKDKVIDEPEEEPTDKKVDEPEEEPDLSTKDVETDDFKRIELSEEERQQRRQTDKEECELWLTEDETSLKNKFKEEEGKGGKQEQLNQKQVRP